MEAKHRHCFSRADGGVSCSLCSAGFSPLSFSLLLSLIPIVFWPSDLCRSHVPDYSLSKQPIDRWLWLHPDSITFHAHPLPLRRECSCTCLSMCSSREWPWLCMCKFVLTRHGLGLFGRAFYVCVCVFVCQFQSLTPGPRSHSSEKTDWFLPPMHKQLTTQRSIRHTQETPPD